VTFRLVWIYLHGQCIDELGEVQVNEEERIVADPAPPLRTPKKRDTPPDTLTMGELERLLAKPERDDVWERHFLRKQERDRLLLALMAYTGLAALDPRRIFETSWHNGTLSYARPAAAAARLCCARTTSRSHFFAWGDSPVRVHEETTFR
jgi:integrase